MKGAGSEVIENYVECELVYLGVENIHAVRASLDSLFAHFDNSVERGGSPEGWGAGIDASKWLTHMHSLLKGSVRVARSLIQGTSVLVHCSDGWDRTSQLCALAQLMLDPYYRTISGFSRLVTKDWLQFGHKFADRACARSLGFWEDHEASPVFIQFIDSVWQLSLIHI